MDTPDRLVRPGVRLALALKDPTPQAIQALGLNAEVNDDKILTAILTDADAPGHEGVFVTADNLRRFKARDHQLAVLCPPEDAKIADEPDPVELENRRLRQELDTRPKLALAFKDQQTHVIVKLQVATESVDERLDEIVEEEDSRIDGVMAHAFGALLRDPPSKAENLRYLNKYREWLRENYDHIVRSRLTFSVDLALANDGRGTATGIDVTLTLPENVFPFEPSPVEIPARPEQPRWRSRLGALDEMESIGKMLSRRNDPIALAKVFARERDGVVEHDEARPHEAKLRLRALKHSTVFPLNVPLWFADVATALDTTGFSIGYRVHADNPPDILEGKLNVKLDVAEIPL
jgi:hypothetical protein